MTKYLLSTGESTTKFEKYVLDLFKLNLKIVPGDIPNSGIGFNFILSGVKGDELLGTIKYRINTLVDRIKSRFSSVEMSVDSVELLSKEKARIRLTINDYTDIFNVGLYNYE